VEYLSFAAISKLIAAATTYPYQVIRARLQDQHRSYGGVWDVIRQTWRYEGLPGMYKGMYPYLLHVTPNICLVFLIYETFTQDRWVSSFFTPFCLLTSFKWIPSDNLVFVTPCRSFFFNSFSFSDRSFLNDRMFLCRQFLSMGFLNCLSLTTNRN